MHENKFLMMVQEAYERLVGYKDNGYTAPELRPQLSRQIKAIALLVDERFQLLEDRVDVLVTEVLINKEYEAHERAQWASVRSLEPLGDDES